jgi:hypothetical protein
MENTHPLLNVSSKAKLGCYAALPGTGPHGATCLHCQQLATVGKASVCAKFHALTGRRGKPIDTGSAACRYYAHRPSLISAR